MQSARRRTPWRAVSRQAAQFADSPAGIHSPMAVPADSICRRFDRGQKITLAYCPRATDVIRWQTCKWKPRAANIVKNRI